MADDNGAFVLETGVARNFYDVTPNVSTNLNGEVRMLYVGTGGFINVLPAGGTTRVVMPVASFSYHQMAVKAISNVGTTATNIVAFI
jgi:hypothetical protein